MSACDGGVTQRREVQLPGYIASVPAGWSADEDEEGVWHLAPAGDTSAHVRVNVIQAIGGQGSPRDGAAWMSKLLRGRQVPVDLVHGNLVATLPDTLTNELGTPIHMRYWYVTASGAHDTLRVAVVSLATLSALPDTAATVVAVRRLAEQLRAR